MDNSRIKLMYDDETGKIIKVFDTGNDPTFPIKNQPKKK